MKFNFVFNTNALKDRFESGEITYARVQKLMNCSFYALKNWIGEKSSITDLLDLLNALRWNMNEIINDSALPNLEGPDNTLTELNVKVIELIKENQDLKNKIKI